MEGPSTTLTFLGIVLDTVKMEMRLSEQRMEELKKLIDKWLAKKAGRKRDLFLTIYLRMPSLATIYRYFSERTQQPGKNQLKSQSHCVGGGASAVSTRLAVADLERIANQLVKDSIADSTRRCYTTGQTTYLTLCSRLNMQPLPAREQLLILFTADLSQRLAFSSIRAYLSAVRFLHISNGHSDPLG